MAFTEQIPNPARFEPSSKLGVLLDGAQTNLSILTTLALQQPRSEFSSDEAYYEYYGGLRYHRYPGQITQTIDGRAHTKLGIVMEAKRLQAEGHTDWSAQIFIPHESMPPEGGLGDRRYIMHLLLNEEVNPDPDQVITVDCSEGLDDIGPRLLYWNPRGLTTRQIIMDNSTIEASYPFHIVDQITGQLKREADALLELAFDGVAA